MKRHFRISVNGKDFEVIAESLDDARQQEVRPLVASAAPVRPAPRPASADPAPAAAAPAAGPAGEGDVVSPLAGKVVSIDAPVGTAVNAGDQVITLEAMKMNTVVTAPVAGTVKSVAVTPDQSVEEGQVLLTIG
jgi:biotin carboxyl carrier protein